MPTAAKPRPTYTRTEWTKLLGEVANEEGRAEFFETNFGYQINVTENDGQLYPRVYCIKFPRHAMADAEGSARKKWAEFLEYFGVPDLG